MDSYADDTTITSTVKTVAEIGIKLSEDCTKVSEWMRSNKLKLNPDKTHIMTIGTAERLRTLHEPVQVTMDNVILKEDKDKTELLLGCHIQANLKWHTQISALLTKLRKRLVGLQNLKHIAPYSLRKLVTEGIFNSVLVYCLPLYGGMDTGDLKDLQVLQNKAAQIVTFSPPRAERSPMYDRLGWLTVNQLIFYHSVIAVFKIRSSHEPEHLAGIFGNDSRNRRIVIPNLDLKLSHKSFTLRGAESWNQMPLNIRVNTKIGTFKKLVKKWIIQNVPRFID